MKVDTNADDNKIGNTWFAAWPHGKWETHKKKTRQCLARFPDQPPVVKPVGVLGLTLQTDLKHTQTATQATYTPADSMDERA